MSDLKNLQQLSEEDRKLIQAVEMMLGPEPAEMGWRVINDVVQIMRGESYVTENEVERAFRDSRLNLMLRNFNVDNTSTPLSVTSS